MATLSADPARLSIGDIIVQNPESRGPGRWRVCGEPVFDGPSATERIPVVDLDGGPIRSFVVKVINKVIIAGPDNGASQTAAQILGETA